MVIWEPGMWHQDEEKKREEELEEGQREKLEEGQREE